MLLRERHVGEEAVSAVAMQPLTYRPTCSGNTVVLWETLGCHNYGTPWLEQRYAGD